MNIPIKYGLMITLVVILWVVVTHFLFPISPASPINFLAPLLFNVAAIAATYLGIRKQKTQTGSVTFKQGVITGMAISFVYAISACLFFLFIFLVVGPQILANEPIDQTRPLWQVAMMAFGGMFLGSVILGLIYSTISAFLLAKRGGQG